MPVATTVMSMPIALTLTVPSLVPAKPVLPEMVNHAKMMTNATMPVATTVMSMLTAPTLLVPSLVPVKTVLLEMAKREIVNKQVTCIILNCVLHKKCLVPAEL